MKRSPVVRFVSVPVIIVGAALLTILGSTQAHAADTSNFEADFIISDTVFTDYNSMSASDIQAFLNAKNSVCLKNFQTLSLVDQNNDGLGDEPYGRGTNEMVSAATLIWQASQLYRISPKVILATLEKEQGLVTRTDCPSWRYNTALGYGCPDSEPCNTSAYGFTRQIDYGVWHFRGFFDDTYPIPPKVPGNNYIAYNPDGSCGGTTLNIKNRATAALYSYTPYQPNAATLAAAPGQLVPCGAYGNLNFWRYFTNWFGSTRYETFEPMSEPRVMEWAQPAYKISLYTGVKASDSYPAGMQRLFKSKAWTENGWCLRTEYDESIGSGTCILMSNLTDDIFEYVDLAPGEQVKSFIRYGCRLNLRTQVINNSDCFDTGREVTFAKKVFIIDQWYLVSQANIQQGTPEIGFRMSAFKVVPYKADIEPRFMTLTESTPKYNVATSDSATGEAYPTGLTRKFVTVYRDENNTEFYQTETDAGWLMARGFPADSLEVAEFVSFTDPRELALTQNTCKTNPFTGDRGECYGKGLTRRFESKILFDGVWYYRTQTDTGEDNSLAFPAYSLGEV